MISREHFKNWESSIEKILNFLKIHGNNAYTPNEIAKALKMKATNVTSYLAKLEKKGLVDHRSPYWAIKIKTNRVKNTKKKKRFF